MTKILGFPKHELLKLRINKLIPPAISGKHTQYIRKWLESYKATFINKTRVTFFINKENYLCPVILYIKLLPTIENGIEVCGLIQKVIDDTFILYKDPTDIKIPCKIGFCLASEEGKIEAVDSNANIYLGLPNLVRKGSHLKITIDKKKINLFNLIPQLKPMNIFSRQVELNTESLLEDYNNDENGLFFNINKRIRLLNQKEIVKGFASNFDYYEKIEKIEQEEEFFKNTEQFRYLEKETIKTIFKKHTLRADVYNFTSSHGDLKLYLVKLYFVPQLVISGIKPSIRNSIAFVENKSLKDFQNVNSNKSRKAKTASIKKLSNKLTSKANRDRGILKTSKAHEEEEASLLKSEIILEKIALQEQDNFIPFVNKSIEKIKEHKEDLFEENFKKQSSFFKCIQFQLYFLVFILFGYVTVHFLFNYYLVRLFFKNVE